MRRHASSVAQHVGMAVWRLDHVTNSGRSAGSTVRHDAKLSRATLSHAGNAGAESAAARNKPSWRPSVGRCGSSVAQDDGMAVPHVGHTIRSCRSVASTVRHDAMLTADSISHAGNAETE